jgi:hypothetical protein
MVVLSLLVIALAACGGEDKATRTPTQLAEATPTQPAAATPTQLAEATPTQPAAVTPTQLAEATPTQPAAVTPTQLAEGTPVTPTFPGSATASVTVGDQSFTLRNGRCDKGPDDGWLLVNIGQVGGAQYFGMAVGNPAGEGGIRSAKGGGEFTGEEIVAVSAAFGGRTFTMTGVVGNKVTLDADLNAGQFVGTTTDGVHMSGSFKC